MNAVGLPMFGRMAPPLRPGFPWHDAIGLAHDDLLFAVHPHRFQFLPRVALAAAADAFPRTHVAALLDDWMRFARQDPALAFCSNLVVIQRLVSCLWAFAFLGVGAADPDPRRQLLRIVRQDLRYLLPRLGDSYPNNHLLLDRFAAWLIAVLMPEDQPHSPDLASIEAAWTAELLRQTYADGGSIEHSTHYHGFATEMATAYVLLAARNRLDVPAAVRERVARMVRLQSTLSGRDGGAIAIGDSSDDPLFALGSPDGGNAASLREIDRGLFAPDLAPLTEGHAARERAWWLLAGDLAVAPGSNQAAYAAEFPEAGLAVFIDDDETTRFMLRTGVASGTHYLPGHQHSDPLSVTLVHRGVPLLVEAGTSTYRFGAASRASDRVRRVNWRAYFAGPHAHNGLIVDGCDPYGLMSGDFRSPGRLAEVRRQRGAIGRELAFREAALDATDPYPAWTRGAIHLRGFGWIVYDLLACAEPAPPMHFGFQWASSCELTLRSGRQATARAGGADVRVGWSEGLGDGEIVSGREHPPNGWVSPSYGERVQAPQLLVATTGEPALTAFAIVRGSATGEVSIQCGRPSPDARCFRIDSAAGTDLVLVNLGPANDRVEAFGAAFEGRIAWISLPLTGAPSVRWLDGAVCTMTQPTINLEFPTPVADFVGSPAPR